MSNYETDSNHVISKSADWWPQTTVLQFYLKILLFCKIKTAGIYRKAIYNFIKAVITNLSVKSMT